MKKKRRELSSQMEGFARTINYGGLSDLGRDRMTEIDHNDGWDYWVACRDFYEPEEKWGGRGNRLTSTN